MGLISRAEALRYIHTPKNKKLAKKAKERLKFEELFFLQLQILKIKNKDFPRFRDMSLKNRIYLQLSIKSTFRFL